MKAKALLLSSRPAFLILTPVSVLLGVSTSIASGATIELSLLLWVLLGALSAHISVNALNEYFDYRTGLDAITQKTPFSGGSGALPNHPEAARAVLWLGCITLLMTASIGLYLLSLRGWQILPIGLFGLLLVVAYTPWLNRYPWLCLMAPGLGFGVLMVMGVHFILAAHFTWLSAIVSMVPFFLSNNLLLLNQFPDREADAVVGRRTFPIAYSLKQCAAVYGLFMILTYAVIVTLITVNWLPLLAVVAILPVVMALFTLFGIIKYGAKIGEYLQYLAANVIVTIVTPLLLAIAIICG